MWHHSASCVLREYLVSAHIPSGQVANCLTDCPLMQVVHALLEDIHLEYKYSAAAQASRFSIVSVQVDNQLLNSEHPVVLGPTQQPGTNDLSKSVRCPALCNCADRVVTVSDADSQLTSCQARSCHRLLKCKAVMA